MMMGNNFYASHANGAVDAPLRCPHGGRSGGSHTWRYGPGRQSSGHRCAGPSKAVAVT